MYRAPLLLLAAAIVGYVGVMHSILGERLVIGRLLLLPDLPLLRNDPVFTGNILRRAWHLTSLAWCAFAVLLLALALAPDGGPRVTATIVSLTLLASAAISLAGIGLSHPLWWLFLVAGTATWIAST